MMTDEPEITPDETPEETLEAEASESDSSGEEVGEATSDESIQEAVSEFELAVPEGSPPLDEQMIALMALESEELDVDQALAAVASLHELVLEQEIAPAEVQQEVEAERPVDEGPAYTPTLRTPPMMTLQRGQMASVIPALVVIAAGAWLTLTLTTSDTPPDARLMAMVAAGAVGVILAGYGLSSGRWARGALFLGLGMLFSAGTVFVLSQRIGPGLVKGWPLVVVALGAAAIVTALLSPADRRGLFGTGLLVAFAGAIGLGVTLNLIAGRVVNILASLWPGVLVVVLALWLLPVIFRRRE